MKPTDRNTVIASYRRLSLADGDLGRDGKDESNSIESQKALIDEYIASKDEFAGMDVMEFVDDGYSGTNFDRPGFQKMIGLVKCGKVGIIVVKDLSRFGRDYIGVGEYLEQIFPVLGVRLIAINSNYDSNDYIGTTMGLDVAVSNLVNTMYSRDTGKKLHYANEVKWKKGYSTNGSTPFGYVFDPENKGRYKLDPPAAAIVRKIFDYALLGMNTRRIAYQLNEEKIPIPSEYNRINQISGKGNQFVITPDKIWTSDKVWRILREYAYTGAMVLGKRRVILSGTNVVREMPKEKRYITEGTHEAIVTLEEFEQAQAVIRNAARSDYLIKNDYALRKRIRCGHCQRVLSQNFNLNEPVVWCQAGREMPKFSHCPSEAYVIRQIENITFYALRHMLFILSALNICIRQNDKEKTNWENELARMQRKTEQEIAALRAERRQAYESYAEKILSLEEYKRRKGQISSTITSLQAKLEQYACRTPQADIPDDVRCVAREADAFLKEDKLTKNAVTAFIENVYVYKGAKVEVRFRFEDLIGDALKALHILPAQSAKEETRESDADKSMDDSWKSDFSGTVLSAYVRPARR